MNALSHLLTSRISLPRPSPWCLIFIFLLSSCSTLRMEKPDVHLVNLKIDQISLFSTELAATIRIDNEMNTPLTITGSKHKIYLGGEFLGKARSSDAITIPALGSVDQDLRVTIQNLDVFSQIEKLLQEPSTDYTIESSIFVDSFFGDSLNLTQSGNVPLLGSLSKSNKLSR